MTTVTIRNLPESTRRAFKARARANHTSMEAEMRATLEAAAKPAKGEKGLGTALRDIAEEFGPFEFEFKRDKTPMRVVKFE